MKIFKQLSLVALMVGTMLATHANACAESAKASSTKASSAHTSSTKSSNFFLNKGDIAITVKGMMCDTCAKSVTTNMKNNTSIKNTTVDLKTGMVKVTLNTGKKLSDKELKKIITDSGYSVTDIQREAK